MLKMGTIILRMLYIRGLLSSLLKKDGSPKDCQFGIEQLLK
jgi:hypothetical protein